MNILSTIIIVTLTLSLPWVVVSNLNGGKILAQQANAVVPNSITPEMVKPHVNKLADDRYEGRGAGYPGERMAAEHIADEFKRIGLKPVGDLVRGSATYFQEFRFHALHPVVAWEVMTSRNVLGLLEGVDPTLKNEIVVIGAHYDGQGRTGQADPIRLPSADAGNSRDEIWNSANDNAASIAAILEIARAIKTIRTAVKRSILFVAFGAEEHGMAGSIHYISHPVFPLTNHVAMINLEKIGRSPEKPLSVVGGGSSPAWQEIFKAAEEQTKTKIAPSNPYAVPESDHYPFAASRIPAVMFIVYTSIDSHQPSDSSDKIDYARVAETARYVMATLLYVANAPKSPEFVSSPIPDLGLVAHLVTKAESDAAGLGPEESGLKVTGVIAGLPSAEAGLHEGDLIISFVGRKFRHEDTYAALMAEYRQILEGKSGSRLPVTIVRNKKRSELIINLRR
jgi:Peptidase family M28